MSRPVLAVAVLLTLGRLAGVWSGMPDERLPAIHVYVFASPSCPTCVAVKKTMAGLAAERDCRIQWHDFDVDDLAQYKRLLAMERRYGVAGGDLPVFFIGEHVLSGETAGDDVAGLFDAFAEAGGSRELDVPSAGEASAILRGGRAASAAGTAHLAYFEQPGCMACSRAERVLELAQERNPGLVVRRFSLNDRESRLLLEALCERAGIPEESRLIVPAAFVGMRGLVKEQITDDAVTQLVAAGANTPPPWDVTEAELDSARGRLIERFRAVGLASVVAGGLIDSINPCAFATLVFFIGYLTALGRGGRDILVVGAAFTGGVYLASFVPGVGLSEALLQLGAFPRVASAVTWGIIVLTFVLAAVSLRDFAVAVRGRTDMMALKLPDAVRMRINRLITKRLHTKAIAGAAFGLGLVVSLLELACTGQVYFPLIRFMNSVAVDRPRALGLLAIYNLAFIVPLVIVFGAAAFGVGSDRLMGLLRRHVAPVKLLMAAFFVALGLLMLKFR